MLNTSVQMLTLDRRGPDLRVLCRGPRQRQRQKMRRYLHHRYPVRMTCSVKWRSFARWYSRWLSKSQLRKQRAPCCKRPWMPRKIMRIQAEMQNKKALREPPWPLRQVILLSTATLARRASTISLLLVVKSASPIHKVNGRLVRLMRTRMAKPRTGVDKTPGCQRYPVIPCRRGITASHRRCRRE